MPTPKLTNEIIAAAIDGFEAQQARIDVQISELKAMLSGGSNEPAATSEVPTGKRKKFSAAARKRMKEAQQRRWAKIRGESATPTPTPQEPAKPKRKLSAAAKAKLVANLKRARAAKAAKAKAAAKKAAPARKKPTAKKAAVQTAPAKAAKRAPVKKATAAKKTAPAAE
jgi:hypothetical protein